MMTGGAGLDGLRSHGPARAPWVSSCAIATCRTTYLDGLGIKFQAFLLVGEELLNILALISLELNHLPHFSVDDDGAIASCSAFC
jgi:hypothetical protein